MEHINNLSYTERDKAHYLQVFRRFPIALERAKGVYVWDADGNKYLDTLAGIAVNNVGHCHPKVVAAIAEQAKKLIHISNFFASPGQVALSERLTQLSRMERVFLTNSGAESVEGAIKLARKYAHKQGKGGTIISFDRSFHGRTMATIATGNPKYQKGFDPIPRGFHQVPFNDLDAVIAAADKDTCAILIEPVQGEGGVRPADREFLKALRKFCDRENIVLIFDEIQCGIGRCGHWFAKDHFGVQPDIMTLAKGLGGGLPVGAILSNRKVSSAIEFGDHGTTFGGNPLVCAAALTTLEIIETEGLLQAATENGQYFMETIRSLNHPSVREVRGLGLMIGVELDREAKPVVMHMLQNGVIANATADNVIRFVPPLIIDKKQISAAVKSMFQALNATKENV